MQDHLAKNLNLAAVILRSAIAEVGRAWQPLLLALIVPMVGSIMVLKLQIEHAEAVALGGGPMTTLWLLQIPAIAFWVLFAVSCHRIILLGQRSLPNPLGIYWTLREMRFAGWVLLIGILSMIVLMPVAMIPLVTGEPLEYSLVLWYVQLFVLTWLEGRISLVLPATAVGERQSMASSWYLTRGCGLGIAIALLVPILVTHVIYQLVRAMGKELYSEFGWMLTDVLAYPLIAVGVAVLSVTYRMLTRELLQ